MNDRFPQLISVQEFIENLNENKKSTIGINKMYSLIKQDGFPSVKIGARYYVLVDQFSDWLDQQMNNKTGCIKNDKQDQSGENSHE